jgi:hypothetical protein
MLGSAETGRYISRQMNQITNKNGIIALVLSCISLMLAIIPPDIIDNKIQALEKVSYNTGSPVSFEIKGVKLSFSKKEKNEKAHTNEIQVENLKKLKQKFAISLYATGILAIFLGIFSLRNKEEKKISIGSLVTASIALAWQYVATGISIGIAIVVVIFLLANFS